MNRKPVVAISASTDKRGVEFNDSSLSLSLNYPRAIQAAGGVPQILPCLPEQDIPLPMQTDDPIPTG